MKSFWKIVLILLVILAIAVESYSQETRDTLEIQEVIINSKRSIHDNSLTVSHIDSLVLQNKANNSLSELLAEHSGIFIKTYGRGAMASASFRGTDPSHTKVLWNGIELNSPMLGMVDFSLIPICFIDKVELLHGSSSISEKPGALGGLVNLSTLPEWKIGFNGSYMQGVGSFGTHDEHVGFNMGNQKLQSQTRIFYSHSDNDFGFTNYDIYDSVNLETGRKYYPKMRNEDAWFSYYGFLQELNYKPGTNNIFKMSFWGQESSRSIPILNTNEAGRNNNINRQVDKSIRGQFAYSHFGEKINVKLFSGLNFMNLDYSLKNLLNDETILLAIDSKSKTSSLYNKLNLEYIYSTGFRVEFSGGMDFHQVESYELLKQQGYTRSRIQYNAMGSVFKKWNHRWTSNLRLGTELISGENPSPVYHVGTEFQLLPEDKLCLRLIFASNTRYPSLNDLYYQPGGNIYLKPETSSDQELSIHYGIGEGGFELSQDLSIYSSSVKNWIIWFYSVKGASPENIDKVDLKGVETNTAVTFQAGKMVYKLNLDYVMTHSRDMGKKLSDADLSYGKQLPYIPIHSGNIMFYMLRKGWSFNYIWNYYSKRNTTTSNTESSPRDILSPYFMNQAGFGKQINMGHWRLDINLKIHNLFNEEYRSVLQRQMPGRNYSLQFKLNF